MIVNRSEAFSRRPSCVLLDLDNTLYSYAPCNEAGMAAASELAQRQLNLSPEDFGQCFRDARTQIKAALGKTASSHHRLLYFQRTVERAGFASQPGVALQLEQAFWRGYLDAIELYPGVMPFLHDLRIAGIPVVIVTDLTAQIQMRKLVILGLDTVVDWLVTSEETGADKPDPRPFELALAKLGGVEGTIWFIGDDEKSDMQGSRNAVGAVTLHRTDTPGKSDNPAMIDLQFTSFDDLRGFFAGLPA